MLEKLVMKLVETGDIEFNEQLLNSFSDKIIYVGRD